ncbi:MAG: hypothetical protein IV100_03380 [Myxococcales bacterium]|nr:hypothetical protein [Myxococcales bacterium]
MRRHFIISLLAALTGGVGCAADPQRESPSVEAVNERIEAAARLRAPDDVAAPRREEGPAPMPPASPAPRKGRPKVPPPLPLRPASPSVQVEATGPCVVLVDRVCDLLNSSSEECGEARRRLQSTYAPSMDPACQESLDFVRVQVDENLRVKPCTVLQDLRCANFRSRSPQCKVARKAVLHLTKNHPENCIAELLLSRAFDPPPPPPAKPTSKKPPRKKPKKGSSAG